MIMDCQHETSVYGQCADCGTPWQEQKDTLNHVDGLKRLIGVLIAQLDALRARVDALENDR
jgi:hypothetical protein